MIKRGDIVTVAPPGDYGKPRPAVVVQTDSLTELNLDSIVLCLMSSKLANAPLFRIPIEPSSLNNLQKPSDIMTDKVLTVPKAKVSEPIGRLSDEQLVQLNRTLAFVMGIG